jgi:hypothetical protein
MLPFANAPKPHIALCWLTLHVSIPCDADRNLMVRSLLKDIHVTRTRGAGEMPDPHLYRPNAVTATAETIPS